MIRFLSILVLAAAIQACATDDEFKQEFWVETDGSGSLNVTAPPWAWNAVKNAGDARNVEGTVNEGSVAALFQAHAFSNVRVKRTERQGRTALSATADFGDINALVGTRAFPDLVVALRREGSALRLYGVWRRPPTAGTAQGDEKGRMSVRFHLPAQILEHRKASLGIERGNTLTWRQDLRAGIAGAPLDFGASVATRRTILPSVGFYLTVVALIGLGVASLALVSRRRRRSGSHGQRPRSGPEGGADFLNYDPTNHP